LTVASATLLVVEDEAKVAEAVRTGLEAEGYEVIIAPDGRRALAEADRRTLDLVLLDLLLPGRDGLDVLSVLRGRGSRVPVLALTALDTVEDRVRGLEAGADDYLTKPFAFAELLARIRALLRRGRQDPASLLHFADLQMDRLTRTARRGDQAIELTRREFDLLEYLLRHQRTLVSREMIAREVWKEPDRGTPLDNVIDVHIARLRRKIDQGRPVRLIHTVRGVGFMLHEEAP
jgi:DNA-binding response OmpR family regulator